jgi:hypothetical protein
MWMWWIVIISVIISIVVFIIHQRVGKQCPTEEERGKEGSLGDVKGMATTDRP